MRCRLLRTAAVAALLTWAGTPSAHAQSGPPAKADILFVVDTTGSMSGAIRAVQADIADVMTRIDGGEIGDVAYGLAEVKDYPQAPFGDPTDKPFNVLHPITGRPRRRADRHRQAGRDRRRRRPRVLRGRRGQGRRGRRCRLARRGTTHARPGRRQRAPRQRPQRGHPRGRAHAAVPVQHARLTRGLRLAGHPRRRARARAARADGVLPRRRRLPVLLGVLGRAHGRLGDGRQHLRPRGHDRVAGRGRGRRRAAAVRHARRRARRGRQLRPATCALPQPGATRARDVPHRPPAPPRSR